MGEGSWLSQAASRTRGTEPRSALSDSGSREGALKANRWRRLTQAVGRLAGSGFPGAFPGSAGGAEPAGGPPGPHPSARPSLGGRTALRGKAPARTWGRFRGRPPCPLGGIRRVATAAGAMTSAEGSFASTEIFMP